MILLVGARDEATVHQVIDWLDSFQAKFLNVSHKDVERLCQSFEIDVQQEKLIFLINGLLLDAENIQAIWFRKGSQLVEPQIESIVEDKLKESIVRHCLRESSALKTAIFEQLKSKKCLGYPISNDINKIHALRCAQRVGFKTPRTLITNSMAEVKRFMEDYGPVVTKPIQDTFTSISDNQFYLLYTEDLHFDILQTGPKHFYPSLIQSKIQKEYELRVFYLRGTCYTMAIFSQNDQQTATDFRRYNWDKMNRMVPYKLPKSVESMIIAFMKLVELDTGSIDLIYSTENEYIFLEVNPVGQYGFVSYNCNYFLEKEIAKKLIE